MKSLSNRLIAASLLAGLLAGCSGATKPTETQSQAPAPASKQKTAATIATAGDAVSLDPHDTTDNLSYSIEGTVYEGLMGIDKEMKVVPVLAESYKASDDAKTFEFKLRKGIKFHTGEELNAAAVKKSFERVADPANKLKRNSLFNNIAKIETPDELTVIFHLKQPFGAMLYNFAHPAAKVIAPSGIDKGRDELARNPIYGTGPFKFKEWMTNDHITVTKNADYWNASGAAKVEAITFKPVVEAGTRVSGLKAGDLDFVFPLPSVDAEALKSDPSVKVSNAASIQTLYMAMNVTKPPFNNKQFREAMNLAIDRESIRKGIFRGYAQPMTSYLPPGVTFYEKQGDEIKRDVAKAKELVKASGYNGEEIEIWHNTTTERKDLGSLIVAQLAEVGIKAKNVPMDGATQNNTIWNVNQADSKLQVYMAGWSTSTFDADWAIRPVLYGDSAPPKSSNAGYYNNPTVNKLIEDGLATADPAKRAKAYSDLQKELWADMPWVPLVINDMIWGTGPNVDGIFVLGDGIVNYNGVFFK